MRLIDADALKSSIAELKKSPWFNTKEGFAYRKEAIEFVERLCMDKEPMVIPVKHGRWEYHNNEYGFSHKCSLCNFTIREQWVSLYNYCPNCGAKMDEEREEE